MTWWLAWWWWAWLLAPYSEREALALSAESRVFPREVKHEPEVLWAMAWNRAMAGHAP